MTEFEIEASEFGVTFEDGTLEVYEIRTFGDCVAVELTKGQASDLADALNAWVAEGAQ